MRMVLGHQRDAIARESYGSHWPARFHESGKVAVYWEFKVTRGLRPTLDLGTLRR